MKGFVFQDSDNFPALQELDGSFIIQEKLTEVALNASALNHRDVWITLGKYPGIRPNVILGSDGAGVVNDKNVLINPGISWGENERFQSEDFHILGMPTHGTFSEFCYVPAEQIHIAPAHLSTIEAASLPLAGVTAYRALVVKCAPMPGEKILISGIGGGVALFAFQYAIAMGCDVYVTSGSDDKIQKAISLGAKQGYNYKDPEWFKKLKKDAGGVDVVIDSAAGAGFNDFLGICNMGARIAIYGGTRGNMRELNPQSIFWKQVSIFGSTMGSNADFSAMLNFVTNYKITPIIDEVIPLTEARKGFEKMKKGEQFGKIVFDHNR